MTRLRNIHFAVMQFCVLLVCGCGTQRVRATFDSHVRYMGTGYPYPSVTWDVGYAVCEPIKAPLFLLDLPIAVVVDTLYLPWDVKDSFAYAGRRRAERMRYRLQGPFQRLQHACISYATNHNGRFADHILEVLDESGWDTTILRDQRSGERPPQM